MHDNRSHPLLEQVPLTVSPFVQLPRATTLPYRYKTMPSALPPSIIEGGQGAGAGAGAPTAASASASASGKPAYVVSPTAALAAHPDDILASCRALREHLAKMQADADADLRQFEARIQARELAEKRRVAPGWLDSEERLLVPQRPAPAAGAGPDHGTDGSAAQPSEMAAPVPEPAGRATAAGGGAYAGGGGDGGASGLSAEALDQAFGGLQLHRP